MAGAGVIDLSSTRLFHGNYSWRRPRHTLRFFSSRSVSEIGLVEVSGGGPQSPVAKPGLTDRSRGLTLRFLVSAGGERGLDALRDARRSLLREELTRGREPGEPSLEDAVFSVHEILWVVRPEQRLWCLQKLEELRRRANLLLTEVR